MRDVKVQKAILMKYQVELRDVGFEMAMIINAILKEVYGVGIKGNLKRSNYKLLNNLPVYFDGFNNKK